MAQFGRALRSGRRGRRFESCHLDHVGASFISLAPIFLQKIRTRSLSLHGATNFLRVQLYLRILLWHLFCYLFTYCGCKIDTHPESPLNITVWWVLSSLKTTQKKRYLNHKNSDRRDLIYRTHYNTNFQGRLYELILIESALFCPKYNNLRGGKKRMTKRSP